MTNPTISELMEAHVHLNLGVYFDAYEDLGAFRLVTSRQIPDFYWNYSYVPDGSTLSRELLNQASQRLEALKRQPALLQLASAPIPPGWTPQSTEAWMWTDESVAADSSLELRTDLDVREFDRPSEEMRSVFEDAYSSAESEGNVGYFKLPPEYGEAYANSRIQPPAQLRHLGGWTDGKCVSVATVAVWKGWGGLYSVATRHSDRRRGFGRDISIVGTKWALASGARGVLLQTTADSEVEAMYRSLGYRRLYTCALLTPNSP